MLAKVTSGAVLGVEAYQVDVEVDLSLGLPNFTVVGLPGVSVVESKERVRAAIKNAGFEFQPRKITVNLAPADVKKEGPLFDLPIALGILVASEQLRAPALSRYAMIGELSLDGSVRPVSGGLPIALAARRAGLKGMLLPRANAQEAALVTGLDVHPVDSLQEAVRVVSAPERHPPLQADAAAQWGQPPPDGPDFAEVRGQAQAKRALEIAAAGGHNILLIGPPGSGKTMLARRLPGILPPLAFEEALAITQIYSVAGLIPASGSLVSQRPFRAPHHSISNAGLVGGSSHPKPGEISLAHHGILFLDELAEFRRDVLDQLRQPLEEGRITISRAQLSVVFPSQLTLVGAMNPCACGYRGDSRRECSCTPYQAERYWNRLSGPILDRIDLQVQVPRLQENDLLGPPQGEPSAAIRQRVVAARERQLARFAGLPGLYCNAHLPPKLLRRHCALDGESDTLLRLAVNKLGLSGRSFDRVLKVARTIADLAGNESVEGAHLAEALQYRPLDPA